MRTGLLLIVLLAVIGVTILRIGQLISLHLFVGFLVMGPVAVKMASTGYRFVRYYTHNLAYRRKGPPELILRLIAPVVVISTVIVFASGIVLMFDGPHDRSQWLLIHKASFFVWGAFTALHVLGHLSSVGASLRPARKRHRGHGWSGRSLDHDRRRARRRVGAGDPADPTVRAVDRPRRLPPSPPLTDRTLARAGAAGEPAPLHLSWLLASPLRELGPSLGELLDSDLLG